MKGLLSLTNSWTLWFSRELTSSREFQHSTLIFVGGIVAQYPPWIGLLLDILELIDSPISNLLFFSSDNNYYIVAIPHSSYTLSRGMKIQFYYFTILLKKVCTKCVTTIACKFSLFLQLRLFTTCFIPSMFTLSNYWAFICQHLAPCSFPFWTNVFHYGPFR